MAPAGLRLVQDRWNTIYRVDAVSGEQYALRLGRPGERTILDIQSELAWLQALQAQSEVMVPRPVANIDGGLVTTVRNDDPTEPRHCVLFSWVPGRTARNRPTERNAWRLGRAMALLHDHADTFRPPAAFTRLRLDSVWTFGHPDLIYSDAPHPLLTAPRRVLLRAVAGQVQGALDELYAHPGGQRFLHIDLHVGNMLVHRGTVGIVDFDDSRWCFPIQDMGISVHALLRRPEGERLTDAFLRGYREVRPLPAHIERLHLFVAARLVDLIGLYLPDPHRQDVAARLLDDADKWLPGVVAGEMPFWESGLCSDTGGAARVRPSQGGHA